MKHLTMLLLFAWLAGSIQAQADTNKITFPTLLSADNLPLMTNATYTGIFGTKVMFTSEDTLALRGFELTKLHPSVINKLNIDVVAAFKKQAQLNAANAQWRNNAAAQNQAILDSYAEGIVRQQKWEAEQARQAAIAARQAWEDQLRAQAAQNDAIRAQAAAKAAEAAMIQALNPTVIQQSTTVIGR